MTPTTDPNSSSAVLSAIRTAAASGELWYASQYALEHRLPRESLDAPIDTLRRAGTIVVRDWVKGLGQGYTLAPDDDSTDATPATTPAQTPSRLRLFQPEQSPYDRGEQVRKALLDPPAPFVCPILIVLNVVWFIVGLVIVSRMGGSRNAYLAHGDTLTLLRLGGLSGTDLLREEWYRLFSACFVHIGLMHLLLNLYALGILGSLAESLWGRVRFLSIYVVSGIAGGCLAMIVRPDSLVGGASGAIWGVMASIAVWILIYREHLPAKIVRDSLRRVVFMLALNGLVSLAPGVSWEAHLGGGVTGAVVGAALGIGRLYGGLGRWVGGGVTLLLLAAWLGGLDYAKNHSEVWRPLREYETQKQRTTFQSRSQTVWEPVKFSRLQLLSRNRLFAEALKPGEGATTQRTALASLATDLARAQEQAKNLPPPGPFAADAPEQLEDYLRTVQNFLATLKAPITDTQTLQTALESCLETWTKFRGK